MGLVNDRKSVSEFIDWIIDANLSMVSDFEIISMITQKKIRLPIITNWIRKGEIIERARKSDVGEIYCSEKDISYITDFSKIDKYGRANRPQESRFYGAIASEKVESLIFVLFAELAGRYDEIIDENFQTTLTVGKWRVKDHIEVADICFSKDYSKVEFIQKKIIDWERKLIGTELDTYENRQLLNLFSEEFSKTLIRNHNDYKISATYSAYVTNENGINGVMYPSVKTDFEGVNVVLTPQIVDERLELIKAGIFRFGINNGKLYGEQVNTTSTFGKANADFIWDLN